MPSTDRPSVKAVPDKETVAAGKFFGFYIMLFSGAFIYASVMLMAFKLSTIEWIPYVILVASCFVFSIGILIFKRFEWLVNRNSR